MLSTSPTTTHSLRVSRPSSSHALYAPLRPSHSLPLHIHIPSHLFPISSVVASPFVAWASNSGPSTRFARQPHSLSALGWVLIRVSSRRAIVGTWISLAPSSSNLVSYHPTFACGTGLAPTHNRKTYFVLDRLFSSLFLATCFVHIVAILMTGIMIYHIRSKYTAVGE